MAGQQPLLLDDRELSRRQDASAEQQADQPECFVVPDFPRFQRLRVGGDRLEVLLAPVEGGDRRVLQRCPHVEGVLLQHGDVAGERQVVADEDAGADGDADRHALVVGVPEPDRQPEFGAVVSERENPEHLLALPGKRVLLLLQGESLEDVPPDRGQRVGQPLVRHRLIAVRGWWYLHQCEVVPGHNSAAGVYNESHVAHLHGCGFEKQRTRGAGLWAEAPANRFML